MPVKEQYWLVLADSTYTVLTSQHWRSIIIPVFCQSVRSTNYQYRSSILQYGCSTASVMEVGPIPELACQYGSSKREPVMACPYKPSDDCYWQAVLASTGKELSSPYYASTGNSIDCQYRAYIRQQGGSTAPVGKVRSSPVLACQYGSSTG